MTDIKLELNMWTTIAIVCALLLAAGAITLAALAYFMHPHANDKKHHNVIRAGVHPNDVVEHVDHTKIKEPTTTRVRAVTVNKSTGATVVDVDLSSTGTYDVRLDNIQPVLKIKYTYTDGTYTFPELTNVEPMEIPSVSGGIPNFEVSLHFVMGGNTTSLTFPGSPEFSSQPSLFNQWKGDFVVKPSGQITFQFLDGNRSPTKGAMTFQNATIQAGSNHVTMQIARLTGANNYNSATAVTVSGVEGAVDFSMGVSECRTSSLLLTAPCT